MFHPPSQDKFLAHKFSPRNDYGCSTILLSFRYFTVYTTSLLEMSKVGQSIIFVSIINICRQQPAANYNRSSHSATETNKAIAKVEFSVAIAT